MSGSGLALSPPVISSTSTPPFVQYRDDGVWPDEYGSNVERCSAVYHHHVYVGDVVLVRRRRKARGAEVERSATGYVTEQGWRPAKASKNAKLTNRADAVARLPRYPHEVDQ